VCGLFLLLLVVDCDDDANDDTNDNDDEDNGEQAPPLLPIVGTRTDNRSANFLIPFCDVLADFFAVLLHIDNERLLLLHDLIEVLEELSELNHLTLDI
jgi:hypothetical protein